MQNKTKSRLYIEAIRDALHIALFKDPSVFVIGEGVPDPKGIFGSTIGLQKEFPDRVLDMPVSENGMTGICIGSALGGLRPVIIHARMDFALYSMDQIVNTAAKWFFMFGGQQPVPIVIRMIIGRGWGQGPQHSQSLQALFAHIPGLKVVMPSTPRDAKGLMLSAIIDNNPVIYIEHRWLHGISGPVPDDFYTIPIGKAHTIKKGSDLTIVATSHMVLESLRAYAVLQKVNISCEIIDLRSIKPFDRAAILASVKKTKRLLVVDGGPRSFGIASEIISSVSEEGIHLMAPPVRITLPDLPVPTSSKLAELYYPTWKNVALSVIQMMNRNKREISKFVKINSYRSYVPSDVPDLSFSGPF